MYVLKTQRLTLRPVVSGDAAALFLMRGHPEYLARAGGDPFYDIAPLRGMISGMAQGNTDGTACCLSIVLDDTVIGLVELFRLKQGTRPGRDWSLGFGLAQPFWRHGYMTEALHAALPAIYLLGAHRVVAEVGPQNQASGNLLASLGFRMEGTQREKGFWGGKNHDLISYALLRSHYEAQLDRQSTSA